MKKESRVTVMASIEGASRYHCDQEGDCATIYAGEGYQAPSITACAEDFRLLAKTCLEAADRIDEKLGRAAKFVDDWF